MKRATLWFHLFVMMAGVAAPLNAQQVKSAQGAVRTIARLVWQDKEHQMLRWGDLQRRENDWLLVASDIAGAPGLDAETQSYTQMETLDTALIAAVHDQEKGSIGSGWVAVDSGLEFEAHGDHFHTRYVRSPSVVLSQVDVNQGNPAHVYRYGSKIYIANDAKNGFTVITPENGAKKKWNASFFSGGGNHITLAVVADRWSYATWADREGDNVGRVDIVPIESNAQSESRSFKLPTGGLHGATTNSGRVFFAPSDGVCIIQGDGKEVQAEAIQHLSLGTDPETGKPYRTGAFANQGSWVLFQFGAGDGARLGMIDASKPKPSLLQLPIPTEDGLTLTTPKCTTTANGKEYAWLIQHRRGSEKTEKLVAVELDPNGDRSFVDARIMNTLELGPSSIEGHSGYHEVALLPSRRLACITNPGDGSIWVVAVANLEVVAKLSVGGCPTRIVAFGD